jgi:hypothetical protein
MAMVAEEQSAPVAAAVTPRRLHTSPVPPSGLHGARAALLIVLRADGISAAAVWCF